MVFEVLSLSYTLIHTYIHTYIMRGREGKEEGGREREASFCGGGVGPMQLRSFNNLGISCDMGSQLKAHYRPAEDGTRFLRGQEDLRT